jgi:hypothetical protein
LPGWAPALASRSAGVYCLRDRSSCAEPCAPALRRSIAPPWSASASASRRCASYPCRRWPGCVLTGRAGGAAPTRKRKLRLSLEGCSEWDSMQRQTTYAAALRWHRAASPGRPRGSRDAAWCNSSVALAGVRPARGRRFASERKVAPCRTPWRRVGTAHDARGPQAAGRVGVPAAVRGLRARAGREMPRACRCRCRPRGCRGA